MATHNLCFCGEEKNVNMFGEKKKALSKAVINFALWVCFCNGMCCVKKGANMNNIKVKLHLVIYGV